MNLAFYSLLLVFQPSSDVIVLESTRAVSYTRTNYEAACRDHVVRIQYTNLPEYGGGRVLRLLVNEQSVDNAVAGFLNRIGQRPIDRVGIVNCGFDGTNPIILGVAEVLTLNPSHGGANRNIWFRLRSENGIWRIQFN